MNRKESYEIFHFYKKIGDIQFESWFENTEERFEYFQVLDNDKLSSSAKDSILHTKKFSYTNKRHVY